MSHPPESAPAAETPAPRPGPVAVALVFLALGAGAFLAGRAAREGDEAGEAPGAALEAPLPVVAEVPDFTFTERSGRPFGRKDLLGRIWVADFIFTNCAGVCPRMTLRMAGVHEVLRKDGDAVCVSFTMDPARDTPEVLREYARKFSASPDAWFFLRGEQAEVQALSYKGFLIGDEKDPFLHSERFVLVDRAGRIRGYYHGLDEEAVARLLRDYRRLRAEF